VAARTRSFLHFHRFKGGFYMELKTPLYPRHLSAGGKMVPFAGYLLPVQYSSIIAEHQAVRTAAGLFDVSHMGEFLVEGPSAQEALDRILTNTVAGMADGKIRYSPMCYESGGTVDDLLIYRLSSQCYMLVVNAACREKDFKHMQEHLIEGATLTDVSEQYALLALQGPASQEILSKLTEQQHIPSKYYSFTETAVVAGKPCLISRTGYTGEDGFELYCAPEDACHLWDALMEAGQGFGLLPCGLGARDTLRLEAGMPLYGHELSPSISPLECGLGFAVKLNKAEDFPGKAALSQPQKRIRVGIKVTGRGIVRENCEVFLDGEKVGITTSGTHSPYLGYPIAMALLQNGDYPPETPIEVDVRGRRVEAVITPMPFYKKA
jgi:aminomethyltransferase